MQRYKIFVDGSAGTTGLRILDRLAGRPELELVSLPEADRKNLDARAEACAKADLVFLCLPDAASREIVPLIPAMCGCWTAPPPIAPPPAGSTACRSWPASGRASWRRPAWRCPAAMPPALRCWRPRWCRWACCRRITPSPSPA